MRVEHKEGMLTYTLTNAGGEVLYSFSTAASDWPCGSFGFRARAMTDTLSNLGTMAFDNLKVTVHGAQAALLAAGHHPNAKIIEDVPGASTDAVATESAAATADMTADTTDAATGDASSDAAGTSAPAAESKTPDGTTAPAGQTDASTASSATSAPAPTDADGVNVGVLIGVVAAALVVIAVIAFIVVKKKKK